MRLMLAHAVELGLVNQMTPRALPALLANVSNLSMFRAVAFSILPLLMAVVSALVTQNHDVET